MLISMGEIHDLITEKIKYTGRFSLKKPQTADELNNMNILSQILPWNE